MKAIVCILSATLTGALLLQGYLAIWHPSSFGPFAELPLVLVCAAVISTVAFLVLVLPSFIWLRCTQRSLSPAAGFYVGLVFGLLTMFVFLALVDLPVHPSYLIAGGLAGAVGVSVYARLVFKGAGS